MKTVLLNHARHSLERVPHAALVVREILCVGRAFYVNYRQTHSRYCFNSAQVFNEQENLSRATMAF